MIEAKYGIVAGLERTIHVDKEWNVENGNGTVNFSTELGPLIVATVISNFNLVTTKADLKNLTSFTYLSLTSESSDYQFEILEKPPTDYTQKELGDVFDAFVRRRNFPLRENVYHIGKLSFRKLMFVQYPSDFDLVEKTISEIEINSEFDEDYVRESYFRTYYDKFNRLHGGTKQGIRKTRASAQTIKRLNDRIVELQSRTTKRSEVPKKDSTLLRDEEHSSAGKSKEVLNARPNGKTAAKTIKPKSEVASRSEAKQFSHGSEYSGVVLEYIDGLSNGDLVNEEIILDMLINLGVNPNPVDLDRIILHAAKDAKIKKTLNSGPGHTKALVYKRFGA